MIKFFKNQRTVYAVKTNTELASKDIEKLTWLFSGAQSIDNNIVEGIFIGPRKEMITPWSTNAVEICQNMGIKNIDRIEEFEQTQNSTPQYDPMLKSLYTNLNQEIFTINKQPEQIIYIDNIQEYNKKEGLALSDEEMEYLEDVSKKIERKLTDSEVFGFSQVNSEHCRHKIFNGSFIIDGKEMDKSLFQMIKETSKVNHNRIISAYTDNVAFIDGTMAEQFAPENQDIPDYFTTKQIETVISLKAETHNFPTTVEPFNGAATGSGGEIRDRMAGGKGSFPIAGTAVYMTSYPRLTEGRNWENATEARKWLYQTPAEILIKASNGASDFGNKFGQPLICGSVLTFEHFENNKKFGFDKVIMLAGGIGFAKKNDSKKDEPQTGDLIVVMGGDNYRIGMGGGAVSSVATGEYNSGIELNAVQRSNPEMQKRVYNAIRALAELSDNPIVSVHDHGAGGHLNALSELVEATGGTIYLDKLPVGDPTLSAKEIIGNESQERMGLVLKQKDIELLQKIAARERAPMYVVGEATGDMNLRFAANNTTSPIDMQLAYLFGKPPKTVLKDKKQHTKYKDIEFDPENFQNYLQQVLQLEAVACKDWLTNKVDRSVTGRVAKQQTTGEIQLPLNDVAVVALDYNPFGNKRGIATSIGHAPVSAMVDPEKGSILSIAEALTNLVFAPLTHGLQGVSLSANWMWAAKNEGENSRLYDAVKAASKFAIELGINIPTGKDSLSMTQKYDTEVVYSPGTVIITAVAEVSDITNVLSPTLIDDFDTSLIYIDFSGDGFKLGGSSFAQSINRLGSDVPTVTDAAYFKKAFEAVQNLIKTGKAIAGHDVSAGGLITTILEMVFPLQHGGVSIDLEEFNDESIINQMFSEKPAVVLQVKGNRDVLADLQVNGVNAYWLGGLTLERELKIDKFNDLHIFDIDSLRDDWFKTSYLLDCKQSGETLAKIRFKNYKKQPLRFSFPTKFNGKLSKYHLNHERTNYSGIKAAIIREKGVNGDREMAYAMYLAGFEVKDVHMTDLISGRETLEDIHFIVFVGGFSNSDVLGSAKGWAGAFLYNEKAKSALDNFYKRSDTLSLGICNGCQLMVELGLIYPEQEQKIKMLHNESHKFESIFLNVDIPKNDSVMFKTLSNSKLGVWVAHGEGKFSMPLSEENYRIGAKYSYAEYPANPNGSDFDTAAIYSADGRHLAMMPHIERSIFPWHWAYYPTDRKQDEITPWLEAFINAIKWIEKAKI